VAEEINPQENEAQEDGNKSKKKLLIIIIIVGVLALLLSVGVTLYLMGGSDDEAASEEAPAESQGKPPATYFDIKQPFLVTYNIDGRQRYMQVSLTVVTRDASVLSTLDHHLPMIMSRLNSAFSSANFNELKTEEGKLALQAQSLKVINEILETEGAGAIENVYFMNFVLQ
jgi:flagellar FliL protein